MRIRQSAGFGVAMVLLLSATDAAQAGPRKPGPIFVVESNIDSILFMQARMNDAGEFLVTWLPSLASQTHTVRRYDASGTPNGSDFAIPIFAAIGMNDSGGFTHVGFGSSATDPAGLLGQNLDSNGTSVGAEFQVNSLTTGSQQGASLEFAANGSFVVAWQSDVSAGTDNSYRSIQARRFDAAGTAIGAEFQVNTLTDAEEYAPNANVMPSGEFVISWAYNPNPSSYPIFQVPVAGQRYDSAGTPIGSQLFLGYREPTYAVDLAENGNFVVAHTFHVGLQFSNYFYTNVSSITASGSVQGHNFGTPTNAIAVGALDDAFIVVWEESTGPRAQEFSHNGTSIGTEFTPPPIQNFSLAQIPNNGQNYLFAWAEPGTTGGSTIYGQLFSPATTNLPSAGPWTLAVVVALLWTAGTFSTRILRGMRR